MTNESLTSRNRYSRNGDLSTKMTDLAMEHRRLRIGKGDS